MRTGEVVGLDSHIVPFSSTENHGKLVNVGLFPGDVSPIKLEIQMLGRILPMGCVPDLAPLNRLIGQYELASQRGYFTQIIDEFESICGILVSQGIHLELRIRDQRSLLFSIDKDGTAGEPTSDSVLREIFLNPSWCCAAGEVKPWILDLRCAFSFSAALPRDTSSVPQVVEDVDHLSILWVEKSSKLAGYNGQRGHLLTYLSDNFFRFAECISDSLPRRRFGAKVYPFYLTEEPHPYVESGTL